MPNTRSPEGLSAENRALIEAILKAYNTTRLCLDPVPHILSKDYVQQALAARQSNTGGGGLREALGWFVLGFDSVHGPNRDDAIQGLREALAALSTQDAPKDEFAKPTRCDNPVASGSSKAPDPETGFAPVGSGATPIPKGWRLVPEEPTEAMLKAAGAPPDGVTPRGGTDYLGRMLPRYWAAMLAAAPTPDQGEASPWRHAANEWADMATGGLQWLRNIRDGVSTVEEALANMAERLAHCQAVSKDAAAPPVTVEGES